mgnify:CR=1 FL=1
MGGVRIMFLSLIQHKHYITTYKGLYIPYIPIIRGIEQYVNSLLSIPLRA